MLIDPSPGFKPRYEVVSCFIRHDDCFLLLLRCDTDGEMDRWGLPAGKIDSRETPEQAVLREVREETGLRLEPGQPAFFRTVYVRYPDYDFIYHMFQTGLTSRPTISLTPREHSAFR